jgi:uncharacterized protein YcfL
MRLIFICFLTSMFLFGCGNKKKDEKLNVVSENVDMETKSLLENVKLAINPKFKAERFDYQ